MPQNNRFGHQQYLAGPPAAPWQIIRCPTEITIESEQGRQVMAEIGQVLRAAGVRAIYLVHGTFVGDDAFGFLQNLAHVFPAAAELLRRMQKDAFDRLTGDAGNYTTEFRAKFADAINASQLAADTIPVRLFHWSSENLHVARARTAVRLIDELARSGFSQGDRVLLWGHSHAGNVFAIVSNLLAASPPVRRRFFRACRSVSNPLKDRADRQIWNRVRTQLDDQLAQRLPQLDLVTFGTPVRYGWDTDGYARLLHFVYHRPRPGMPEYLVPFPPTLDDVLRAADGDYVQHWGIAGTNLTPYIFAWRTWLAELRLGRFVQRHVRSRDLLSRLKLGIRVPQDGTSLLVDYGDMTDQITRHHAGHAVYTFHRWLVFHASEVAQRFYGFQPPLFVTQHP